MDFYKKIVDMELDGKKLESSNIFFTDETQLILLQIPVTNQSEFLKK